VRAACIFVLFCLAPSLSLAQVTATFGPRGEIVQLRVGDVVYLQDLAVTLSKPGWTGAVVDQRAADPAAIAKTTADGATIYQGTLRGERASVKLREVVRVTPDRVSVDYELSPGQDLVVESVYALGTMPAAVHAGTTRYVVGDESGLEGVLPVEENKDTHVILGARPAEWLGFLGPAGTALRVTPTEMLTQLQDSRRFGVPGYGLLWLSASGKLPAGKTIRFGLAFSADTAERMTADAKALSRNELLGLRMADDRPLHVGRVAADRTGVEVFSRVEVTTEIAGRYDNPFDPDQIAVDALVTRPDGTPVTVPGFYYVPMRLEMKLGHERLRVAGPSGFRVRYTPTAPGSYRLVVKATDRSGSVTSVPVTFTATAGKQPGFVRVAPKSPLYFATDDGRAFFAVGEDMAWANGPTPIADYTRWLTSLGKAGGNWARLFLSNWEKGLEWMPAPTPVPGTGTYLGLGRYAQDNAWRLDEVVRMAGESDVRLLLCLGTFGEFYMGGFFNEGCWVSNPYNAANGGPCATADDFWTNERARKLYRQRLRYLIARWGYSPDVFGWEFWNEVPPTPANDAWLAEMAAYVKANDPNRHLVSTTYGDATVWRCPDVDFSMKHTYGSGNIDDFTPLITEQTHEAIAFGKPYLQAEFGLDWRTGDDQLDPKGTGLNMHNGAWANMMAGAAGTSMLWYWDSYVDPLNVYRVLTPVRKFAGTVDWAKTRFVPVEGLTAHTGDQQPETFSTVKIPATLDWGKTPSAEYTVGRDGSVSGGPIAMTLGALTRGIPDQLYSQTTWHVDMPQAGKVLARLGQVCQAARLQISVDGNLKLDRPLASGEPGKGPWKSTRYLSQYKLWVSDYDEDLEIDVPAGKHTITFVNTEGDWLQIRSLTLPSYRSSRYPYVDVLGLTSDRLVLLWVHNRESTWRTEADGKQPHELASLRLTVPVPADGAWRVRWWDTFKGGVLHEERPMAADGALSVVVPTFARDLAARVERGG
jgi:hypothetical protein